MLRARFESSQAKLEFGLANMETSPGNLWSSSPIGEQLKLGSPGLVNELVLINQTELINELVLINQKKAEPGQDILVVVSNRQVLKQWCRRITFYSKSISYNILQQKKLKRNKYQFLHDFRSLKMSLIKCCLVITQPPVVVLSH